MFILRHHYSFVVVGSVVLCSVKRRCNGGVCYEGVVLLHCIVYETVEGGKQRAREGDKDHNLIRRERGREKERERERERERENRRERVNAHRMGNLC